MTEDQVQTLQRRIEALENELEMARWTILQRTPFDPSALYTYVDFARDRDHALELREALARDFASRQVGDSLEICPLCNVVDPVSGYSLPDGLVAHFLGADRRQCDVFRAADGLIASRLGITTT